MDERDKWKIRKKGYLKIYIAVDVKSKKILSMMKITYEHVHDSKALPELIGIIIKSDNMAAIGNVLFVDGAYECNDIFRCISNYGNLALN